MVNQPTKLSKKSLGIVVAMLIGVALAASLAPQQPMNQNTLEQPGYTGYALPSNGYDVLQQQQLQQNQLRLWQQYFNNSFQNMQNQTANWMNTNQQVTEMWGKVLGGNCDHPSYYTRCP
ncbi:hypothetical protein HYR54_05480 [Candidatus Acetothermia bacterium]|nr:hypothetical protein [Candidatus Acetothermia bacterium]